MCSGYSGASAIFPGVADIGVVIHRDHHPALPSFMARQAGWVPNGCCTTTVPPGPRRRCRVPGMNERSFALNVVEHVHDGVRIAHVVDRLFGKHAVHGLGEDLPLLGFGPHISSTIRKPPRSRYSRRRAVSAW